MEGNIKVVKSCKSCKKIHTCIICDYTTNRKWCFDKHKLTRKHLKNARGNFGKFENWEIVNFKN